MVDDSTFSMDLVILGGGVAGLWLLNRLRAEGYAAVLLESEALGGGQTIASQGIIHGGLKYALSGALTQASNAVAGMPDRWRRCLSGNDEVDLRGCRVLSENYYMWSNTGYRSRLKTFLGSKALQGRIEALSRSEWPPGFRHESAKGALYRLADFVVDPASLIQVLADRHRDHIFKITAETMKAELDSAGNIVALCLIEGERLIRLSARRFLLAAGEGNGRLLTTLASATAKSTGGSTSALPEMQTRALHMVMVRHSYPHPLFVHCIGDSFNMTPRLTVTSHPCRQENESGPGTEQDPHWVWYLGGELAEAGVNRSHDEQIEAAQGELAALFPWISLEEHGDEAGAQWKVQKKAQWDTLRINRAEPRLAGLKRPDRAWVKAINNFIVIWPTKLTLSPDLGDAVHGELTRQQLLPEAALELELSSRIEELKAILGQPPVAASCWSSLCGTIHSEGSTQNTAMALDR